MTGLHEIERYREYRNTTLKIGITFSIFTFIFGGYFLKGLVSLAIFVVTVIISLRFHILSINSRNNYSNSYSSRRAYSTIRIPSPAPIQVSPAADHSISINPTTGRIDLIETIDPTPVTISIVPTNPICPLCKKENDLNEIFCKYCGNELKT